MAVFFLALKNDDMSKQQHETLKSRLFEKFGPENVFEIIPTQYMLNHPEFFMPQKVSEFIGDDFGNGHWGSYLMIPVTAYWGYHDHSTWNWLAGKI